MSLLQQYQYLVFDHFHTDLQAFPTDVPDNLVLVSELCQFRQQIGAHVEADLLRAVLFDCLLSKRDEHDIIHRASVIRKLCIFK